MWFNNKCQIVAQVMMFKNPSLIDLPVVEGSDLRVYRRSQERDKLRMGTRKSLYWEGCVVHRCLLHLLHLRVQ